MIELFTIWFISFAAFVIAHVTEQYISDLFLLAEDDENFDLLENIMFAVKLVKIVAGFSTIACLAYKFFSLGE